MMALSNAERQARYQKRLRERASLASAGITAADIDRASQILYEGVAHDQDIVESWADWVARLSKQSRAKARDQWEQIMPTSADPEDYPECIPLDDREFLARVGAVICASRYPAKHR